MDRGAPRREIASMPAATLADTVLFVHAGIVLFVVLGLPVILIGNRRGWTWVNRRWWRMLHLVAIGVVVLQAWLGRYCGLTELESWLRAQAGQPGYERSFMAHWVQHFLYYDVPLWLFSIVYTCFGLLVAWAWWRYPPTRRVRGVG